jgi:hypothetical protein
LRVAYDFSNKQIATAFLSDERTVAQRIVRAKQQLRDAGTTFELPEPAEVPARRRAILDVLYQLFTEGYSTTASELGIDEALCRDSLRLARLLTDDDRWASPDTEALRALICFHVARTPARRADDGSLILLHEQDRSLWDAPLLAEGFLFLGRSARGQELSCFHVEAAIAACHAKATSYAATEWEQIVSLYDVLREMSPSPIVDVNRALAIAMVRCAGPASVSTSSTRSPNAICSRATPTGSRRTPSSTLRSATWKKPAVFSTEPFDSKRRRSNAPCFEESSPRSARSGARSTGSGSDLRASLLADFLLERLGAGSVRAFVLDDLTDQARFHLLAEVARLHFVCELHAEWRRRKLRLHHGSGLGRGMMVRRFGLRDVAHAGARVALSPRPSARRTPRREPE